jgi:hypothetical protein
MKRDFYPKSLLAPRFLAFKQALELGAHPNKRRHQRPFARLCVYAMPLPYLR